MTKYFTGFAEIPANVTVELGAPTPPCRCRHTSSDANTFWRVNGSPSGQFSDIRSGSVNESGTIVHTLTIPAEPQYNGTVVVCVGVFFDGSPTEVTPAATILFFTRAVSLQEITYFDITPSPLTVAVEQGTATFQCQHPLAIAIGWRVNGISLNVATLQNISDASVGTPNGVARILSIGTLLVYNGTTIECIVTFIDGSLPQFTTPVPLVIQGMYNKKIFFTLLISYASVRTSHFLNEVSRLVLKHDLLNYLQDYWTVSATYVWLEIPPISPGLLHFPLI